MSLKERVKESINRKLSIADRGSLIVSGLFVPIRRMKVIERLLNGKDLG